MRTRVALLSIASLTALGFSACDRPAVKAGPPDGGTSDAGVLAVDASLPDASLSDSGTDAGPADAGPDAQDAGVDDAGPDDAGIADAGPGDAGPPPNPGMPAIACNDTIANVYVTPPGLPPLMPGNLGDVVRCAPDVVLSTSDVQTQLAGKSVVGVTAVSGSNTFRIAYRTTRADGVEGVGTARVFLPTVPLSGQLPVIVSAHGSDGLADSCAPSMDPTGNAELSMPFAGSGYAVIAPDYAGLGNEGTQGYLDSRDTAHSTLDAARALRKLLAPGALSSKIIMLGYSQGGGAVLSSQALMHSYGADGDLAGVVVFAAEWETRLNSFQFVNSLNNPMGVTITTAGITNPVIYILRQYAYQVNDVGPSTGGDGFPAAKATAYVNAAQTQCLAGVGAVVDAEGLHLQDLFDQTLAAGVLACIAGNGSGSGCTGTGQALYTYLTNNVLQGDPAGAPIVYIQGLLDTIMVPSQEAACNIRKLQADGVTPQVCTDSGAEHTTVVARNVAYALSWVDATLNGTTPPACTASGMPACVP
jgi:predicted esterase